MKDWYEGDEGTPGWHKRKKAFLKQELLKGWEADDLQEVVRKLTDAAVVRTFEKDEPLYTQGSDAAFIFFVFEGRVGLLYDGDLLFSPGEGTSVGEYPLLDIGSTYYVSAIAEQKTIAGMVSYAAFESIAGQHPALWKGVACKLAGRMNFPRDADAARKHVVVLVHGIRTRSAWQPMVQAEFARAGLTVQPTNFGFFDVLRFLLPIRYFRKRKIEEVHRQLQAAMKDEPHLPPPKVSILAHSFGSYIVAEILADWPDIEIHRLAFCGSIVPRNHRFTRQLGPRIRTRVVNDIGSRDFWPALANSVTAGYGATGTYGFNGGRIKDRWFEGLGHSDFFQTAFCRRYWIPFFKYGRFEPDPTVVDPIEPPPCWWCGWLPFLAKGRAGGDAFGRCTESRPTPVPFPIEVISSAPFLKLKVVLPVAALAAFLWWKGPALAKFLSSACT